MPDPFPAGFSGSVPLFPLPNVVLFPGRSLPLHVFEPRYRAMVADALAGERLIAMALLAPGWEPDYHGNPPVHEVVGIGRITACARLPDGKYNLTLAGLSRARIVGLEKDKPYRLARVEPFRSAGDPAALGRFPDALRALAALCRAAGLALPRGPDPLEGAGALCDLAAEASLRDSADRQRILAEPDVPRRVETLLVLLARAGVLVPGRAGPADADVN